MSSKALYRQYRSKTLSDIVGQEPIIRALSNSIKMGRLSHAYLFTGPRGVGKTSVARILAHNINNLDYENESNHIDIIEIDAASNGLVNDIRELREKASIAPSTARYKVYIIDEVHMLSKSAFGALLKILEEPPEHVIFIMATTELDKLPMTIISRSQKYNFKKIPLDSVVKHLKYIANEEKITIDETALKMIAKFGDGSLRDSISALDQVTNQKVAITSAIVSQTLGIPPSDEILKIVNGVKDQSLNLDDLFNVIDQLISQGFNADIISSQLIDSFNEILFSGNPTVIETHKLINLMKELLDIGKSSNQERYLEIVLADSLSKKKTNKKLSLQTETRSLVESVTNNKQPLVATNIQTIIEEDNIVEESIENNIDKSSSLDTNKNFQNTEEIWKELLDRLKKTHNTLYGTVKMAKPLYGDDSIEFIFKFRFHQKRLLESKNHSVIIETLANITSKKISIVYSVDSDIELKTNLPKVEEENNSTDDVTNITKIFEGAELI